jgi:hypothetical protein
MGVLNVAMAGPQPARALSFFVRAFFDDSPSLPIGGNDPRRRRALAEHLIFSYRLSSTPSGQINHAAPLGNRRAADDNPHRLAGPTPRAVADIDQRPGFAVRASHESTLRPLARHDMTVGMTGQWITVNGCVKDRHA